MDPKSNLNNDISGIICDKDLVFETEVSKVKLEEADKKNTLLRDELKDLIALLNARIQTYSHNIKTYKNECLLRENFDTQVQSLSSLQNNSPKGNMLKNQNNFSNKSNTLIPQMNNDLAPPATSDPDLKPSMHSSHNNSKILEFLIKAQ